MAMRMANLETRSVLRFAFAFFICFIFIPVFASAKTKHTKAKTPSWTELARKVGESEDGREAVISELRHIKHLNSILKKALYTSERPLALDVISALELKELIPDLLFHVPADPDGFLTVAINSMMDPKNQPMILKSYVDNLAVQSIDTVSSAAIVAMLEPLGRLSIVLPKETMTALESHRSPEVRSSLIYYVRVMGLRNRHYEYLDALNKFLNASEFQIRLQTVSVSEELLSHAVAGFPKDKVPSQEKLKTVCGNEKSATIKSACLALESGSSFARIPASSLGTVEKEEPVTHRPPMCSKMEKAFDSKSTFRVRMIFGYKDARPARFVGDRHERLAFIERVTSACTAKPDKSEFARSRRHVKGLGVAACGFVRSRDNADLFMKHVTIRGKDHKVLLWVVNSSVGTDDQENISDPFQRWKSKYAEEAFLSGLRDSDVVLYDGHSRFGGGPDFTSPKLAADGTVDPTSYQNDRPGLSKMLSALKDATPAKASAFSKLKLLGLFSCSSDQHFTQQIHDVSKAGVVSSKVLMYYSDALRQSLSTLDDVLRGRCSKAISF